MTSPWYVGNAESDAGENRSWLVGHFKKPDDIRYDEDVEIKVSSHATGEQRPEWSTGEVRRTFVMLIAGRHRIDLAVEGDDGSESVVLATPGDYVVWSQGVAHTYMAEEASTIITVRWPSIPPGELPG